ncbi:hypothetical protein G9A89_003130 [Geosiphon pyriformis]|nr:hypothetical protein G9A89_003130 [Geosiphon pyriformis]
MSIERRPIQETYVKDAAFSDILHGKEIIESDGSFFTKVTSKDKAAHEAVVKNYLSFWEGKEPENETSEDIKARQENYTSLTNSYYNIATDFYEYGWGTSFHFCRFYPNESFEHAISRHEHYLAMQLNVKPGMNILDIGCGVGGPAREICHFTGAHITGLNNNDYQIQRAKEYSKKIGLESKTDFVKGNFMDIPFENNSFDAVYAIEATCHAPKLEDVYGEAYRVLKPGGIFAIYEWCTTENYDSKNPEHQRISRGIEVGDGIPKLFSTSVAEKEFRSVGFEVQLAIDLAVNDDKSTWYHPLEGDYRKVQSLWDCFTVFRMTRMGKYFTRAVVGCLEKLGIAPAGSIKTQKVLETAQDSIIQGGRLGLFTPMFLLVGKKPTSKEQTKF